MICNFIECKQKCAVIIGDCRYCSKHYCAGHRLPEDHKCDNLGVCRKNSFEKNKIKLMNEKLNEVKM